MALELDRPRLYVDLNEMVTKTRVLLSKVDVKVESSGQAITLHECLKVFAYMDDIDEHGQDDNIILEGYCTRNTETGWASAAKWCLEIEGPFPVWQSALKDS